MVTNQEFKARMEAFGRLSKEGQVLRLRQIGILGVDGNLTTRFGGSSPLDTEAMKDRQQELAVLTLSPRRAE